MTILNTLNLMATVVCFAALWIHIVTRGLATSRSTWWKWTSFLAILGTLNLWFVLNG